MMAESPSSGMGDGGDPQNPVLGRVSNELAAWIGILGIVVATLTITIAVVLFDGFSWGVHDLSTLGHADMSEAEQSRYVFSGGMILTGLLGLAYSVGLYRIEDRVVWKSGAIMYALSHVTLMWQGVFPAGVPQHNWLTIFPFFTLALLLLGIDQLRFRETRLFGVVLLTNLVVGVLGAALLVQTDIEGWAIHEMLGVIVFMIATILFAFRLLGVPGCIVKEHTPTAE